MTTVFNLWCRQTHRLGDEWVKVRTGATVGDCLRILDVLPESGVYLVLPAGVRPGDFGRRWHTPVPERLPGAEIGTICR